MPRVPKTNRRYITDLIKGQIISLLNLGTISAEISRQVGIPARTVSNFIRRYLEREDHKNQLHLGGPRKSTAEEDQRLIQIARTDTRFTYAQVREQANSTLSLRTIRRRLKDEGIRKWRAANCAQLNDRLAAARLEWALEHANWTVEDWSKICWSDECSVKKGMNPNAVWVFRRRGEKERFLPGNVRGHLPGGGASLMIWGCFTNIIKGPLVPIYGRATADTYIQLLETHVVPYMNQLSGHNIHNAVFQQDNAPIHKAHKVRDYFRLQQFPVMHWPASSPDMNPIEHIWAAIKMELHRQFPDTNAIPGGPAAVQNVLAERLLAVWADIGPEVIAKLVESMPRRIAALIEAGGWYTKY
jgi:transposase